MEKIKVKTKTPLDGRRNFTGVLKDFKERILTIECEGGLVTLAWNDVEKSNLVYEFND